jgi:hypothetical protein
MQALGSMNDLAYRTGSATKKKTILLNKKSQKKEIPTYHKQLAPFIKEKYL